MSTNDYKGSFVSFLLSSGALTFGDFTLKSGRQSPYMVNTGKFNTGLLISELGSYYAAAIVDAKESGLITSLPDVIFGSAYKGIPLAVTTSIALAKDFGIDVGYCFNRKEAKDHGEGGNLVGLVPTAGSNVLIVDDVMTAGTALREVVPLIASIEGANIIGSLIAVDRKERGQGELSAVVEASREMNFPVFSIVDAEEIADKLSKTAPDKAEAIRAYLKKYKPAK
ncbi:MAG: orotate phosphoribosyltransferase [Clostridiales Family XIII bacterium]|nr:orotate phosphoribosyltransferase [Clostridiales Family XIII bacterium]